MKKDSKGNQAKYVELNLFPEEIEDHQKDSISSDSNRVDVGDYSPSTSHCTVRTGLVYGATYI